MRGWIKRLAATALVLFCGTLSAAPAQQSDPSVPQLRVGIVKFLRPSPNEPIIEPTLQLLQKLFPEARVTSRVLTMDELSRAIRNRSVDIFIASAGFYRREAENGASAIAAVAHVTHPNPNRSEGSAFVVRRDLPVDSIRELKGLRVMAATPDGFTAIRVAQGELFDRGYDPRSFFSSTQYSGPGDKVADIVKHLKAGTVDVGIFRTCWIEDWAKAHPEDKYDFRVIEPRAFIGGCQSSTALYPSWVIAMTPQLSPIVSRGIARAILDMPATESGHFWSLITDFSSIDELFKKLQIGPYQYLQEWSVRRFVENYRTAIIAVVLALLALIAHSVRTSQLVKKRTRALRSSLAREQQLKLAAMEAADHIDRLQRTGIIGQISSMIAHELRQPLATLSLYAKGLRRIVKPGMDPQSVQSVLDKIETQIDRVNSIVEDVRSYAKSRNSGRQAADLREICRSAITSWKESGRFPHVAVHFTAPEEIWLTVNALEWEIVILNLIKNAAEAQKDSKQGLVAIHLEKRSEAAALLTVSDNGPGLSDEELAALAKPLASAKSEGLGLGLSIVRGILEAHGARLEFTRNTPSGTCAAVSIPLTDCSDERSALHA